MDRVECEGATIDEAIENALRELGVPREKAEIEILSNESRGLFGMGGRVARVRAIRRGELTHGIVEEQATASPPPAEAPGRNEEPPPAADAEYESEFASRELVQKALPVLEELIRLMGIEAKITVEEGPEGPYLSIHGDGSGILIGRQGQTLDALEYLVTRIVAHEHERAIRIGVDAEGYRTRRREQLQQLARRTAARAKQQGKPIPLDPMTPRDRRIVHMTLRDDPSVTTRSSGEGQFRQVVVVPRGRGQRPAR